jgi:hypothetical protein
MQTKNTAPWPETTKHLRHKMDEVLRRSSGDLDTERKSPLFAHMREGFVNLAELWRSPHLEPYIVFLYLIELLGVEAITSATSPTVLRDDSARDYQALLRQCNQDCPEDRAHVIDELRRVAELLRFNPEDQSSVIMAGLLVLSERFPRNAVDLFALATGWSFRPNYVRPARPYLISEDFSSQTDAREWHGLIESVYEALQPRSRIETRHGHETTKVRARQQDIQRLGP